MPEKTVSEAIAYRRSVRVYDNNKPLDTTIVKQCIELATIAPTSSNLQLWEFYHVTHPATRDQIAKACFDQSAAKTAQQFVIPVVRKDLWKSRAAANLAFLKGQFATAEKRDSKREKNITKYYSKLIPILYKEFFGVYAFFRQLTAFFFGLSKPMYRQVKRSDLKVIAHKSTALAAQNFMISMAAQGYDTCPMEGFDSKRIKASLGVPKAAMINMVISCGVRGKGGIYGPRFRVPFNEVYFEM